MLENIRQDYCRITTGTARRATLGRILLLALKDSGFRAVCLYRIGHWCRGHRWRLGAAVAERSMHHLCHCCIITSAELGPGFRIAHAHGITMGAEVVCGANCEIRQNVTLGGNFGKRGPDGRQNPTLGDNVSIGPGAVLLGPIHIGSHTFIVANSVVTQSVPERSIVTGFQAEVVPVPTKGGAVARPGKRVFLSRRELYAWVAELEQRLAVLEAERQQTRGAALESQSEAT